MLAVAGMTASLAAAGTAAGTAAGASGTTSAKPNAPVLRTLPGYTVVNSPMSMVPDGEAKTVTCPGNTVVVGGGPTLAHGGFLLRSAPTLDGRSWQVTATNPAVSSVGVAAMAACALPPPGYHVAPGPVGRNVAGSARQQATCTRSGTVPLAVGGSTSCPSRIGLSALYIDQANGLYRANAATNQSPAATNTVQAIAICSAPPPSTRSSPAPSTFKPTGGDGKYSATASVVCVL